MEKLLIIGVDDTVGGILIGKFLSFEGLTMNYSVDFQDERIGKKLEDKILEKCRAERTEILKSEDLPADLWESFWDSKIWISFNLSNNGNGIQNAFITRALPLEEDEVVLNLEVHLFEQDLPEVIAMLSHDLFRSIFGNVIAIHKMKGR